MQDWALRLYHNLPCVIRSVPASLWGIYLRLWRYSSETEQLVTQALEREQWSFAQWKQWQEERLAYILHRAVAKVPHYCNLWAKRRRHGDRASWEYIENWPILEKEAVRENPAAFVADDCNIRYMFHEHTSGTTGKPIDLWWSRKTMRLWYALFEARCRRWYGVSRHNRWAIFGGQLVTPVNQRQPPFWVWNAALNQLYMSSYHLAPDLISYYLKALQKYRIKYLWGYSSSLYALAEEALRHRRQGLTMTVAISNAEPLFDYQRQAISEAFQCPVRETYGMAEIVAAASECASGRLHLWPEVGAVEVFENDSLVSYGMIGDFVCTGLLNSDMPLIRYRIGDRGILLTPYKLCNCGRSLPLLASVEGRVDDILYTADGRRIGRLDPVFKEKLPIREVQIVQETLKQLRVRYVPAPEFTPQAGVKIIEHLKARMGEIEVILEQVEALPRTANGKLRAVVCHVPAPTRPTGLASLEKGSS